MWVVLKAHSLCQKKKQHTLIIRKEHGYSKISIYFIILYEGAVKYNIGINPGGINMMNLLTEIPSVYLNQSNTVDHSWSSSI